MQVLEYFWLREADLNHRPSGYEPDELPDCSIPRQRTVKIYESFSFVNLFFYLFFEELFLAIVLPCGLV